MTKLGEAELPSLPSEAMGLTHPEMRSFRD